MLGVIIGSVDEVIGRTGPDQPIYADLLEIRAAALRSASLTRQLLAFARKQVFEPRVLDLNEAITGALRMLHRLIGEDITLTWQPQNGLWYVLMDPSQIDQILANLFVNVRDAISGVGHVTIEIGNITCDEAFCKRHPAATVGDFAKVVVADNGCGMNAETVKHIFEPFYTTKEVGGGTGLGLAMVYGIVKQNHGFIEVQSTPGLGSTFSIYLPRYQGSERPAQTVSSPKTTVQAHETILLVEDEPSNLKVVTTMLLRQGYTVLSAPGPVEALKLAKEYTGPIHLLMTDVIMPEMNGVELSRSLLADHPHLKCLLMSGYTADLITQYGATNQGICFIQKPFSRDQMAVKLREAFDSNP